MPTPSIQFVLIEFIRLTLGLAMAYFHRQIADYILEQERSLVLIFRSRGVPIPAAPSPETSRTIYFLIGMFVVLFELVRIWLALQGKVALS
jgi:hypothetical protein